MFVKFINKYKIEHVPKHLYTTKEIDGEMVEFLVCSRTDAVMNQLGYYKLIVDDYPDDTEYTYIPWYEKAGLAIHQHWEQGEKIEPIEEQPTELQAAFNALADNTEDKTTIKGIKEAIKNTAIQLSEATE